MRASVHLQHAHYDLASSQHPFPPSSSQVCFLLDCTGSMQNWINACKERVVQIATRVIETVEESGQDHVKVRMAFVSYRDYAKSSQKYDVPGIRVCNFTEDIHAIKAAVSLETASGGSDFPEVMCVFFLIYSRFCHSV